MALRIRTAQLIVAVVIGLIIALGIGSPSQAASQPPVPVPAPGYLPTVTGTKAALAYHDAAVALKKNAAHLPVTFLENAMEYGGPVDVHGEVVGLLWACAPLAGQYGDGEQCGAGVIWQDGKPVYDTWP